MKRTKTDATADELELLRSRYQLILDSAGEGIYGLDRNGKITFSNAAARYKKRGKTHPYADFRQLANDRPEPVVFLGGKDYLPLFERLTADVDARKVAFYRSTAVPRRSGIRYVRYETPARTNWHYLCARRRQCPIQIVFDFWDSSPHNI